MNRFFNSPGSKENAPRMIVKDKGYWYMCSRPRGWELKLRPHGFNAGDCCWWTGLSVLGYDDDLLLQGLLQLTPIKGGAWRRHPFGEDLESAKIINQMDSEKVYEKLLNNLTHEETRKYLQKVRSTQKKS